MFKRYRPIEEIQSVIELEQLLELQSRVKLVYVDETVKRYIVELANQTRNHENIYMGVSPRGSIALMKAAQAMPLCMVETIVFQMMYKS